MRRWYIGAIFVVGLALGGTVVWLVTRSDNSSPSAAGPTAPAGSVSSSPSPTAGVSTNAQELINRLNDVSKSTYHVRYSTGSASGSHAVLETWHTAAETRRDVIAVSPTQGNVHTEEFVTTDKYVRCVAFAGGAFQCVGAALQEGQAVTDPLQGANKTGVVGRTVTSSTAQIAGATVTCYVVAGDPSGATGPSKFCLASNNVPLLIDGGDGKPVEATNFDTKVPTNIFTPPATVAGS